MHPFKTKGLMQSPLRRQHPVLTNMIATALCASAAMAVVAAGAAAQEELGARRQSTQKELVEIESRIRLAEERKQDLAGEIDALEKDRATINRALIETSARQRGLETRITESEDKLSGLRGQEEDVQRSLASRRDVLAEVLAALQRMGANPPPAILVSPDDALAAIRSAIVLGAVVPEIRQQAEILAIELGELKRLREEILVSRELVTADLSRLVEEEARLTLLLAEKKKLSQRARDELATSTAAAARDASRAETLAKLVARLDQQIDASLKAEQAAAARAEAERKADDEKLRVARNEAREALGSGAFADTGRIAPAIAFETAQGLLPRPVSGVKLRGFGERAPSGEISEGEYVATRANASVAAPADSWVVYSGPFRSYGQLLILNGGNGYHVVLAGLARIDVQLGQFVLAGEPVAAMGEARIASSTIVEVDSTRPVLYIELRKDGNSIDPSPWWAETSGERKPNDS